MYTGTAVELAIWRPISGSTYERAGRWMQALSDPWEQEPWRPRIDMPAGMTGAPSCLVYFGHRLFFEVGFLRGGQGGRGAEHLPGELNGAAGAGSGASIAPGDLVRLSCEYSVRHGGVRGGYGALDETCSATLVVYPAKALLRTGLVRHYGVDSSVLSETVGQSWLTQHTMTYDTQLDTTPVGGR